MAETTRAIPDGYKDEAEFLDEARRRFQEATDSDKENRLAALEDLKFLAGEQWDAEAKTARKGRPCLTINVLPQSIAQVVGDIRINRPAIRVRPAEDADKDLAEVREGLIRAIERDCDAQGVYATTGQSQVACGIGQFRVTLKYATNDGFDRDIAIERIPNPFAVAWDPLSIEPTGRDARYCFVVDEWPRKDFEAKYKNEMPSELVTPTVGMVGGWQTRDTVRVTEYWLIKETPVELAMLEGGKVCEASKVPPGAQVLQKRNAVRKSACMYLITGHAILSGPHEMPVDRMPIIRVQGWEVNVAEKRVRWGLVRFAKDSQRLKNYWRSVSAEVLAMAPKGKWLAPQSAVNEDMEDSFRKAAQSAEPLLLYNGQGGAKPEWINPPAVPAAILQEAALNAQDIKDVTGLHDASLGIKSNETSGKAILARQREGDVATYIYTDNLQAAIAEGGRVVEQLIPVVYDTARTIRVVGEDDAVKVQRINDPQNPDSVDINKGKFDVYVEAGPSYSTKRVEAAESMIQFMQAVPQAGAIAGDLVAKAMDWPMADIIAARLNKMLPPGLTDGEDGDKPREPSQAEQQQAQAAQQQQQAQMGAMELDLRKKHADALTAEYGADQARAEAITAMIQAGLPIPAELERLPLSIAQAMQEGEHAQDQHGMAMDQHAQEMSANDQANDRGQQAHVMDMHAQATGLAQDQQAHAAQMQQAQQQLSGQGSPTPGQPATGAKAA